MARKIRIESVDLNDKIHVLGEDTFENLLKVNDRTRLETHGYYRDFFHILGQENSLFHWSFVD